MTDSAMADPVVADPVVADPVVAESALAEAQLADSDLAEPELASHLDQLIGALRSPQTGLQAARRWGRLLAAPLTAGHRLLVAGNGTATVQEVHLVAIHAMCDALDAEVTSP